MAASRHGLRVLLLEGLRQRCRESGRSAGLSTVARLQTERERSTAPQPPRSGHLAEPDAFGMRKLVSVKGLFDARVHLGHKTGLRNEFMKPFLFGHRLDVDIFDLDKTAEYLVHALNFVAHVAYNGGIIMFVSRNRQTMPLVETTAKECGEYAHCRYWTGGIFTNSSVQYGAVTRLPDLCILLHTLTSAFEPHSAITDCAKLAIPTVGIVDSDCDPRYITYPVPGNDDTPEAVALYCRMMKEAILAGKRQRQLERNALNEAQPKKMTHAL